MVSSGRRRAKVGGLPPGQVEAGRLASGIGRLADTSHGFRPTSPSGFRLPSYRTPATKALKGGRPRASADTPALHPRSLVHKLLVKPESGFYEWLDIELGAKARADRTDT